MTTTLLGYLARFSSFSVQSEVLCTQGLAYLLKEYRCARAALAYDVERHTGVKVEDSLTWLAEALQSDGGRPDLEARTANRVPVVKIEAKLAAALIGAQLRSYAEDLCQRNSGDTALLVLVPKGRSEEAAKVTAAEFELEEAGPWRVNDGYRPGIAVISWDNIFDVLGSVKDERCRYEVEQLQSMYIELSNDFVAPLASVEDLRQWKSSETDFYMLVDLVTRRLSKRIPVFPKQTEQLQRSQEQKQEPGSYHFRYVSPFADDDSSCYSIGVRDPFKGYLTPIWMRFHKGTGNFGRIRQRLDRWKPKIPSEGHIWIPLEVEPHTPGDEMVEQLINRTEKILRVAYDIK